MSTHELLFAVKILSHGAADPALRDLAAEVKVLNAQLVAVQERGGERPR